MKLLLSNRAAARYLGIDPGRLKQMALAGEIPHRRSDTGRIEFWRPSLDAWMDEMGRVAARSGGGAA